MSQRATQKAHSRRALTELTVVCRVSHKGIDDQLGRRCCQLLMDSGFSVLHRMGMNLCAQAACSE